MQAHCPSKSSIRVKIVVFLGGFVWIFCIQSLFIGRKAPPRVAIWELHMLEFPRLKREVYVEFSYFSSC